MSRRKPDEMQTFRNEAEHKYFHQMLNMTDDDLDPYQYRLLGHYLRWAGHGGNHPEGLRETAKVTRMSINKVRAARDELVANGYIKVQSPSIEEKAKGISSVITVVDRWVENINRYAKPVSDMTQVNSEPVLNLIQVEPETCIKSDTPPVSKMTHSEEHTEEPKKKEKKVAPLASDVAPIGALIKAWLDAGEMLVVNPYANKGYRSHAQLMLDAQMTPEDVTGYTLHLRKDKYWAGKPIPISEVSKGIGIWKKSRQPTPAPTPVSDEDAPKPSMYGGYFQPKGEVAS